MGRRFVLVRGGSFLRRCGERRHHDLPDILLNETFCSEAGQKPPGKAQAGVLAPIRYPERVTTDE
jgi:hypothetical protein